MKSTKKVTNGKDISMMTKRGKWLMNIGTWNVRGLNSKEPELVQEFKKNKLLGITETKKKGQGFQRLENNHILMYSGVVKTERARGGVGLMMKEETKQLITDWKFIDERLMCVKMSGMGEQEYNIIVTYGPQETAMQEEKERYYQKIQETIDDTTGPIILMGDLNGRVGRQSGENKKAVGKHGEDIEASPNGNLLTNLCSKIDLVITNTMFPH